MPVGKKCAADALFKRFRKRRKTKKPTPRGWLRYFSDVHSDLFLDPGRFSMATAHVVKLRPPHTPSLEDFNLIDRRRNDRKNTLNTNAVGNLADSERFTIACATTLNNGALKLLHAFFISFFDFYVNIDCVAGLEIRMGYPGAAIVLLHKFD